MSTILAPFPGPHCLAPESGPPCRHRKFLGWSGSVRTTTVWHLAPTPASSLPFDVAQPRGYHELPWLVCLQEPGAQGWQQGLLACDGLKDMRAEEGRQNTSAQKLCRSHTAPESQGYCASHLSPQSQLLHTCNAGTTQHCLLSQGCGESSDSVCDAEMQAYAEFLFLGQGCGSVCSTCPGCTRPRFHLQHHKWITGVHRAVGSRA